MDWQIRREHILVVHAASHGRHFRASPPLPLDVKVLEEKSRSAASSAASQLSKRPLRPRHRLAAHPHRMKKIKAARQCCACIRPSPQGKDEPAGWPASANLQYAIELAERGYIAIVARLSLLRRTPYDFATAGSYASGTMKAIWDNLRAVDLLETCLRSIQNGSASSAIRSADTTRCSPRPFDPRLKAVVSSCGFTSFHKDDMPSWTGPRYMPRIKPAFGNDAEEDAVRFPGSRCLIRSRPFLACCHEG